jgi:GNAT superfamily N-acetyltransferase
MRIFPTDLKNADDIAHIVSESNKDVAVEFNLNIENAPKHPSFYTKEWVLSDFQKGEEYFLYKKDGVPMGCVAFEQPDANTAYLNRLSVLPPYRHKGIGTRLVFHIIDYSRTKNIRTVSIGIIASHKILKNWYLSLGFIEGALQKFDHLPFDVRYLRYDL